MFELSYQLIDDSSSYLKSHCIKPEKLDQTQLVWYCFLGDIRLKGESADFSTQWHWIPALHFTLAMLDVCRELSASTSAKYNFSESDASISFARKDDEVEVTSNYEAGVIKVKLSTLTKSADNNLDETLRTLTGHHPELENNPVLKRLVAARSLEVEA